MDMITASINIVKQSLYDSLLVSMNMFTITVAKWNLPRFYPGPSELTHIEYHRISIFDLTIHVF